MKTFSAILAAAALAYVAAECPNACSGNGICGANDACTCFDNYMGGDCSQRVCTYGLAFVDTPLGDLNHDGVVDVNSYAMSGRSNMYEYEQWTGAHAYTECSGKGMCNRDSGECECFDGFTGSACQRTTCPNDCSGHGQCYTLREVARGSNRDSDVTGRNFREISVDYGKSTYSGVLGSFDYDLWDADKNQACVCDPGFFGPDCSLRECPRGDDPLTNSDKHCGGSACQNNVHYYNIIYSKDANGVYSMDTTVQFRYKPANTYVGLLGTVLSQKLVLKPGLTGDDYAELVEAALHTFPNNELGGVRVTCDMLREAGNAGQCDEVPTLGVSEIAVIVLKVDYTKGPEGSIQNTVELPEVLLWAVDGGMDGSYTDMDVVAMTGVDPNDYYNMNVPTGVTARTGVSMSWSPGSFDDAVKLATAMGTGLPTPTTGNKEMAPCSNRGLCDYATGQCQCFAGYSREDCSVQAALAM